MWLFCYFNFERNHDVLKSTSPCFLLNKKVSFNKDKTESKIENHTHGYKEINVVSARARTRIKNKTDKLELAKDKKVLL